MPVVIVVGIMLGSAIVGCCKGVIAGFNAASELYEEVEKNEEETK